MDRRSWVRCDVLVLVRGWSMMRWNAFLLADRSTTIGGVITDSGTFDWGAPMRTTLGDPDSDPVTDADGNPVAKFPLVCCHLHLLSIHRGQLSPV